MSSSVKPAPIYQPLADPQTGIASLPWILFFNSLFTGDTGTPWLPLFTNLTVSGASPIITGNFYQIGQSLCYFTANITPGSGGSTSSTAGTTFINNFPLKMAGNGINFAVSGLLGSNSGMCDSASNGVYVPSWTSVTVPLTIVGMVEAS